MNLADDLHILRQLRVPYKHELIQWVAHLYTNHPEAMQGIDGKDLKDMIYSRATPEDLAKVLETAPPELKGQSIDNVREASRPSDARTARRSSRPTDSRNRRSR